MIQELQDIVVSLLRKSDAGDVKWLDARSAGMRTTMDEDFIVLLPNSSINVFRKRDGIRLNILDGEGNVIMYVESGDEEGDHRLLESLLSSARRTVMSSNKTLLEIRNLLSKEGKIGEATPRTFKEDDDEIPF